MSVPPPPIPRPRRRSPWFYALVGIGAWTGGILLIVGGIFATIRYGAPEATKLADKQFGDQWLKTSVALIELHKERYGEYPDSLKDLKFIGDWDQNALANVRYYPNQEHTAYYIEVKRGWIGKPDLKMPDEFWRGTGYTESLKPAAE